MWKLDLNASDYDKLLKKHFNGNFLYFALVDDFGNVHYWTTTSNDFLLTEGVRDVFPLFKSFILGLKRRGAVVEYLKLKYKEHSTTYKLFVVKEHVKSGLYLNFFFVVHEKFVDRLKRNFLGAEKDFLNSIKGFILDLRKLIVQKEEMP